MTAEIYLNNLQHDYMNVNDANLIIFNECHQAVLNHSFKKVTTILYIIVINYYIMYCI